MSDQEIAQESPAALPPQGAAALLATEPSPAGDASFPPAADQPPAPEGSAAWWQQEGEAFRLSVEQPGEGQLSNARWIEKKGFKGLDDMVTSLRQLEASRVPLPKGPDDKAGWDALARALGRPDKPSDYQVDLGDAYKGDAFVESFKERAHALGLPPHAVQEIAKWFVESVETESGANAEKARIALQGEWGRDYQANLDAARRAMERLSVSPDDVNLMAAGYGLAPTMKMLARIGRGFSEDNGLIDSTRPAGMAKTLEQHQARKAEILANRDLQKRLTDGDPVLQAEWADIIKAEAEALQQKIAAGQR